MTRLLLVRHGITELNRALRYQGQSPVPLSPLGRAQAELLRDRLAKEALEAIYTSDLRRAVETAEIIGQCHPIPIFPTPELRELSFGCWEGLTHEEIKRLYPGFVEQREADPEGFAAPGGESLGELRARLDGMLKSLATRENQAPVLLVTHGGPIRCLLCALLGVPLRFYRRFRVDCGSLSIVDLYTEGVVLSLFNDVGHLQGLKDEG